MIGRGGEGEEKGRREGVIGRGGEGEEKGRRGGRSDRMSGMSMGEE